MAKGKVQIKRKHDDNSLHIYINRPAGEEGYYIEIPFELRPVTAISPFGDNPTFEWQGSYNGETITVSLPRATPTESAVVSENFPRGRDSNKMFTYDQLQSELKRVLRGLN